MYAIQGEFRRFVFDRAVFTFGRALEAELNAVKAKNERQVENKRQRVLDKWLDQPLKFRAPQATSSSPTAGDVVETMSTKGSGM
jgi:hypothetical protein